MMPIIAADLADLVRLLEENPEWQEPLARILFSKQNVQRMLLADSELLIMLRGLILGEEMAQLPALVRETRELVQQGLERTAQLETRVGNVEATVEELKTTTEELKTTTEELKTTTERIEQRQRGEEGRRRGEEYERRILRQAWHLLNGGEGGTPDEPHVRARLKEWMAGRLAPSQRLKDEADPSLSDILWWKGERVALVEVSLKVNGEDIRRARLRADTLREAGVDVLPIVIGEEWATPESRALAEQEGVAWKVGDELSPSLMEFRAVA